MELGKVLITLITKADGKTINKDEMESLDWNHQHIPENHAGENFGESTITVQKIKDELKKKVESWQVKDVLKYDEFLRIFFEFWLTDYDVECMYRFYDN